MEKLYRKNELVFSLLWIALYIVLFSLADALSDYLGIIKIITFPVTLALALFIVAFIRKNRLWEYYGVGRFKSIKYGRYLFFLPLVVIATSNLWNGITIRYSALETILFIFSMFCVGFIEELIFRGFLFRAIAKKNMKAAIIVSSVTFGFGHIVNLLNGAATLPTILQIIYATAIGYLFTVFFIRSKNLIPCIVTHGIFNALSVFAIDGGTINQIISTVALIAVSLGYAIYLNINVHMAKEPEIV
jgi:membrane protease YdiL (CAAX protease family)